MLTKFFEIHDRATCIQAMAIKMEPDIQNATWLSRPYDPSAILQAIKKESYLLAAAGYGFQKPSILLIRIAVPDCQYDPYDWETSRTMLTAHKYITEKFDELTSGDCIDVEFILGETTEPKESCIIKYGHRYET